jgi:formylglycine-generating enzyme required for sulfatase activity
MSARNQEAENRGRVDTGGGALVEGDVIVEYGDFVGRDKIVQNIGTFVERALSAVEDARQKREFEVGLLADGVKVFAERLEALASDVSHVEAGIPYKGLLEYRLSDTELFFGRDEAIGEFLQHLERGPLTVLHAESGAGKTSLLQAGIAPRLIGSEHLPVHLRSIDVNPALAVKRAFLANLNEAPGLAAAPLREFLRQVTTVLGSKTALYIFFDQFEEFFTLLNETTRPQFVAELAECVNDRSLDVHWVLAMRTEFFGELATFRPRIRRPFENDYRLNRLTRAEAQEVVVRPASLRGIRFESGLVDTLLDHLGKDEISPPQLQLVCKALYEDLEAGETVITEALYEEAGGVSGILGEHLDRVLKREFRSEQRPIARRLLEALITSEGRRARRPREELAAELVGQDVEDDVLEQVLGQMVDSALLRIEEVGEDRDIQVYELTHDYLLSRIELDPVAKARKAAQELLAQEVQTYRRYGTLLSAEKLVILEAQSEHLFPDADALNLLFRSAQERGRALHWWQGCAVRFGVTGELADQWIEALVEGDPQEVAAATSLLVNLSDTKTVSRLLALIEAQSPADQESPLRGSTSVQRRALTALAQMEHPEAEAYLRRLTPEGYCFVPAGLSDMGSDERPDEQPEHLVRLPAFWIAHVPVTAAAWRQFVEAGGYTQDRYWGEARERGIGRRPVPAGWKVEPSQEDHPVRSLTWHEAMAYAAWKAETSRLPVALPTEAEWEKAAGWDPTAKQTRRHPWGDTPDPGRCNIQESNKGNTTPVGGHSPAGDSPCGAQDMAGNVLEWTRTEHWSYPYRSGDGRESTSGDGPRVLRGGAFNLDIGNARCARRHQLDPAVGLSNTGCRMCLRLVPLTDDEGDESPASGSMPG